MHMTQQTLWRHWHWRYWASPRLMRLAHLTSLHMAVLSVSKANVSEMPQHCDHALKPQAIACAGQQMVPKAGIIPDDTCAYRFWTAGHTWQ